MAIVKAENSRKDIPLVSIIAVCYNHENYVEETLNSILNQTYENIELIIIDSFSNDNSVEVIERWIKQHVIECLFIKQNQPTNICQNLNEGLRHSNGKYYEVIACDDIFFSDKTKSQVELFDSLGQDYGLIYSDVSICDQNGTVQKQSLYDEQGLRNPPSGNIYVAQAKTNCIKAMTKMVRYDAAKSINFYDSDLTFEDVDFFLRFSQEYKFYYQNRKTGIWRRHQANMTNQLYDDPGYLNSRLKAYLKHMESPVPEVRRLLRPKIKKILIILHKSDKLNIDSVLLKEVLKKYEFAFRLMIKGILPFKMYFLLGAFAEFASKVKYALQTPTLRMKPNKF